MCPAKYSEPQTSTRAGPVMVFAISDAASAADEAEKATKPALRAVAAKSSAETEATSFGMVTQCTDFAT